MTNPLRTLQEYGQSVWLDFVSRELLKSGGLKKLIDEDGLRGVTSNPSIFEKAIGHGDDYDELIAAAEQAGDLDPGALFEDLAIRDIQEGADALSPVYEQTQRPRRLHLSIEVSPYLAMQTHETIEEARRLWRDVGRRNLMVKVPAHQAGPAGDPHADRRGHQRQHHAAVLAEGLRRGRRGLHLRPRGLRREGRRPAQGGERRELFRQPHRHAGRRGARQEDRRSRRSGREGSGSPSSRARWRSPTPSSPIGSTSSSSATSAGSALAQQRRADAAPACGPAPAPRTRPIATCSMSRS